MVCYLNIVIGPMMAGKTDNIISVYNKWKFMNKKILIVNHSFDLARNGNKSIIETHNKFQLPALICNQLKELETNEQFQESDIVIIDESQFFDDLYEFITKYVSDIEQNKTFFVYGLSGDRFGEKIGQILDLIPIADSITHLTGYCSFCKDGTIAPFTFKKEVKIQKETEEFITPQISVGRENYFPVCRYHYLNRNLI